MQTIRNTRTRPVAFSGFTLLELMLVITIAGIILGIGVPNMRQFMLNNRMTSAANDLLAALSIARTESIKRHAQAVMCFSTDPDAAVPPCDGDGAQGWVVFIDNIDPDVIEGTDNNLQVDVNETVLLRHTALPDTINVGTAPGGNAGYVAFSRSGFTITAADDLAAVIMCDERDNQPLYGDDQSTARAVQISPTGRPAVTRSVATIAGLGGCP